MTLEQLKVMRKLNTIPRKKNNFLILYGADVDTANALCSLGFAERAESWTDTDAYCITKAGWKTFTDELARMVDASKPLRPQMKVIFGE